MDRDDPSAPALTGMPDWIEGELVVRHIHSDFGGLNIDYDKYIVDGVDVDPATVEPVAQPAG